MTELKEYLQRTPESKAIYTDNLSLQEAIKIAKEG